MTPAIVSPMMILMQQLTPIEARVLGCLIEKSITTPEYYPLTLNALVNACNQKSNRNPFMQLEESEVLRALDQLRLTHKLAAQTTSTGNRVPKYKHTLENGFTLDLPQVAILCELLIRGAQTVAELRTRSMRMTEMPANEQVEEILNAMAGENPLVVRLPLEPGRREVRYQHLLCGMPDMETRMPEEPARLPVNDREARISALEQTVEQQQMAITTLQDEFEKFRKQFT